MADVAARASSQDTTPDVSANDGPRPDLKILREQVYRGPNYWSYDPAINLLVDLGSLEEWPTDRLPGFTERILELLPNLHEHSCSRGHAGGFVERLQEGTWLGHVAEHAAIAIQRATGAENRRGKTRGAGQRGRYHVIYGYTDENVGLECGRVAVRLVNHLIEEDPEFDLEAEVERVIRLANRVAFGPSTQAILEEAVSRDIPIMRLDEASLVQLGQGVHQRRIRATITSGTSHIGVDIAGDKDLTKHLLAQAGLPVPRGEVFRDPDNAVAFANRIGYPVVVKPLDGNHGRGVGLDIRDDEALRRAFESAASEARRGSVIVEQQLAGSDFRFLVVGGRVVAIAKRVPAHVTGDGERTVRELVDAANADPRRGIGHENVLTRIALNEAAEAYVREQGYGLDAVVPPGEIVMLARTANMSTGGISIDCTDEAHPDNLEIAEQAAQVVGLDVAGIDFLAPDIGQSVRETGGGVVEVNAAPGFRMHTHPTVGDPQYVAKPVVDLLFPPATPSRIPIVAITGTNGKTTTARMVAHIFKGLGRKVGLTSTDGVFIDNRIILKADASGPKSARMVLQNPRVDFAVFEVARGGILREGLGYERNDVAVVLNIAPDHLGLGGIDTLEQLADVKQVVVEAVPRDGTAVLNADDRRVRRMARACSGNVIWFSMDPSNDTVDAHCRRGGRAIVLESDDRGDKIVLRQGSRRLQLAYAHDLPATYNGLARMNIQNAMAAAGAALAAGAHLQDVRQGLRTFDTSFFQAPGRLNIADIEGTKVVVDYCHNAHAMRVLGDFVERLSASMESSPRRVGVVGTAGDRRDEDLRELGEVAGAHLDHVVVREDVKLRGRKQGEAAALIVEGVEAAMAAGSRCGKVEVVLPELEACAVAFERSERGDIVVLCVEQTREVWQMVEERRQAALSPLTRGATVPQSR